MVHIRIIYQWLTNTNTLTHTQRKYHFDIDPCLLAPLIWCKQNATFAYHSLEEEEEEEAGGRWRDRLTLFATWAITHSRRGAAMAESEEGSRWEGGRDIRRHIFPPGVSVSEPKAFQMSWLFFRITWLFIIQRHTDSDKRVCILATMSCTLD